MITAATMLSRPIGILLSPLLHRQGRRLRKTVARLSEPTGPRTGTHPGRFPHHPLQLLVVGESTAVGVGVDHTEDSVSPLLAAALSDLSLRAVEWQVAGRTGAHAQRITHLLPLDDRDYDLAVVLLGVNDALRLTSRRRWRGSLVDICEALSNRLSPAGLIVVVAPPDLDQFEVLPQPLRWTVATHGATLDADLQRLAASTSGPIRVSTPPIDNPDMFAADSFHPNAGAYLRWADHIAAEVWRHAPERWRLDPVHLL